MRRSTTNASILIRDLSNDITEKQFFDKTNRNHANYAMVVDDNENIYVGETLAGEEILRRVIPVANPSETNTMTIAPDYIELQQRSFNQRRGHIVNVEGLYALTWYNGSIWGIDWTEYLIVEMEIQDIPGSINKRAVHTENVVEIPRDIQTIGDITRGDGCWYVLGEDGTPIPGNNP